MRGLALGLIRHNNQYNLSALPPCREPRQHRTDMRLIAPRPRTDPIRWRYVNFGLICILICAQDLDNCRPTAVQGDFQLSHGQAGEASSYHSF
jgi:hypothetical protein